MNQNELLARLSGFEWNDFECKRAQRGVPEEAYKTVSAFSSTVGGWLVFGVSERGGLLDVSGVEKPDKVQNDFLTALRSGQKLNRKITVEPRKYEIKGKHVFAFHVPEASRSEKPVYLQGDPCQSYIRRGAGDEQCAQSELERFMRDAAQDRFDGIALADIPAAQCFDLKTVTWYQTQFARRNPEHVLINSPLVSEAVQRFRQIIGVSLTREQADVLALALRQQHGERISLTDIRGLGIGTTRQALQVAEALIRQQLLQPVGETLFEVSVALGERLTEASGQAAPQVTPHVTPQVTPQVSPQVLALLAKVSGEMARQELIEALGLKDRKYFSDAYLQPALDAGVLEMTIPDKPRSSKQRYRLTDMARASLKQAGA